MKPFNLEKALAGEPVVTRCGHKVTDLKHYPEATQVAFCIAALVHGHTVEVETFKKSGAFTAGENGFDLFMAEPEIWVNIYYSKAQNSAWCSQFYESEQEAKEFIVEGNYQTTIKIKP